MSALPRSYYAFVSKKGRRFRLGRIERTPPRFKGDTFWQDMWPILHEGKRVGKLWRDQTYGKALPWSATLRELCFAGPVPPIGIGFDVVAFASYQEALIAFVRNADGVLDWRTHAGR